MSLLSIKYLIIYLILCEYSIEQNHLEHLDLTKLKSDAMKYPKAGVPVEKMRYWNHLDEYFQNSKTTEEEADPGYCCP